MKALSLHPMYAADIATGNKVEEYRTWQTNHRGNLLICASQYNDGWFFPRGYALCVVDVVGMKQLDDVDDKLIKVVKRKPDEFLFDWWQYDLGIIAAPKRE